MSHGNSEDDIANVAVVANHAYDVRDYATVEFQFATGSNVTVLRSLNGVDFFPTTVFDGLGNPFALAATPGIYNVDGHGFLKFPVDVTLRAGE